MEVLNTISQIRSEVPPMLVPENTLPLARIKVAFIIRSALAFHYKLYSRYFIEKSVIMQVAARRNFAA